MTMMMRETLIPRSVCTLHFLPYHCKLSQFEPLGPQKFNLVSQSFDISHKFGIWMVKCFVSGRSKLMCGICTILITVMFM